MRNKYRITAVSLLVVTLFFGTAMTSAIAGSVSQPSSTNVKATGCPLCASQGNSEGQNSVAAQLPGGGGPSVECDLKAMAQVAFTVTVGLWNIVRNIDLQEVKALIKQGFSIAKSIGLVVSNFIQKNSEKLTALAAIAIYAVVSFSQTEFVQKALAAFVLLIPGILTTLLTIVFNLARDVFNLLRDDGFQQFMLDAGKKIVNKIAEAILKICKLCNTNPPQVPTGYIEPTSVPSASQSMAQSTMQTAAPSIQQSSVSSVSSSQSSSVISRLLSPPSTQPSSVSSLLISPSVISQPIAAPSTQQSSAAPVMIGVANIPSAQQATNN